MRIRGSYAEHRREYITCPGCHERIFDEADEWGLNMRIWPATCPCCGRVLIMEQTNREKLEQREREAIS